MARKVVTWMEKKEFRPNRMDRFMRHSMNEMVLAFNAELLSTADEYAVSIWNLFFRHTGSFHGDEDVLQSLESTFRFIGNEISALEVSREFKRLKEGEEKQELPRARLHEIFPHELREKIRDLYHPEMNHPKYILELQRQFDCKRLIYKHLAPEPYSMVLDIGAGAGFIPLLFKHNGHHVDLIDVPGFSDWFDESCRLLGLNKTDYAIEKFTPMMDFGRKFDIITAVEPGFDRHQTADAWRTGEWRFFLQDLRDNHLTDNGYVWLDLPPDKYGGDRGQAIAERNNLLREYIYDADPFSGLAKLTRDDIGRLLSQ